MSRAFVLGAYCARTQGEEKERNREDTLSQQRQSPRKRELIRLRQRGRESSIAIGKG